MSWLIRHGSLRSSMRRRPPLTGVLHNAEPGACLDAFRMHWLQASSIMEGVSSTGLRPTSDDITSVLNHLDQMVNYIIEETTNPPVQVQGTQLGPILDYMLMEGVLDRLFQWSTQTGEFLFTLKLEQLRMYEILVSHSSHELLFHRPFLRPLLHLLSLCGECAPVDVEKRLVVLLNTLCVSLSQHPDLLEVFFNASSDQGPARFLIFSLLIPFVHREGAIGQQARDALLLCMALSGKNENIGQYIAEHSNFCPVLATGLSGLYSVLPRKLPLVAEDWYRLTPEDIQEMPELAMFLNSLEFCNAVIQVSHSMVQEQLLEYIYQGFLVPVLGPALHQDTVGLELERLENSSKYSHSLDEIITATAYLELFLRTVTEPALLKVFFRFLLLENYESHKILKTLVDRIGAESRLCLVTLAVFRTLLDFNCEDIMLELVFQYLIPCSHVMVSQRSRVRDVDLYSTAAERFLCLIPACCTPDPSSQPQIAKSSSVASFSWKDFYESLPVEKITRSGSLQVRSHHRSPSISSFAFGDSSAEPVINGVKQRISQFQTNYITYLMDAHHGIRTNYKACKSWSAPYDGIDPSPSTTMKDVSRTDFKNVSTNCQVPANLINPAKQLQNSPDINEKDSNAVNSLESSCDSNAKGQTGKQEVINGFSAKDTPKNSEISEVLLNSSVNSSSCSTFDDKNVWQCTEEVSSKLNHDQTNESSLDSVSQHLNILNIENVALRTAPVFTDDVKEESSASDSGIFESRELGNSFTSEQVVEACSGAKSQSPDEIQVPNSPPSTVALLSRTISITSTFDTFGSPDIGPFLSNILTKLEAMLQNDVYTNLQLTALISRLAFYPQPLLRSFLLSHSLVFQPSIRSLFQVLGALKHKVDSFSYTIPNFDDLLLRARQFFLAREERLLGDGPPRVYGEALYQRSNSFCPELLRGEPKRRSFKKFFRMLGDSGKSQPRTSILESIPDQRGYRYIPNPTAADSGEGKVESLKTQNAVLCAVVLEEFLKELAAISQEHAVYQLEL